MIVENANTMRERLERLSDKAHEWYGSRPAVCGIVTGKTLASFVVKGRDRLVSGIVNTSDRDLDREVVLPSGCDSDDYMKRNKSVFVDHDYEITKCVGKCRTLTLDTKGKPNTIKAQTALMSDENPYAKTVRLLLEQGGVGLSIGFEAIERGRPTAEEKEIYKGAESIVRRWKMIEYSFTAMPCNVACQAESWTTDESKAEDATAIITKAFADSTPILKAFGLVNVRPRRSVLFV